MRERDLETEIAKLVAIKNDETRGKAERAFAKRVLQGMRYSYEKAGGLIEYYDPGWGEYCSPL